MNWPRMPLADVANFCLGKMLDEQKNRGEALPYLANVNVRWGEFDLTDLRQMRFEPDEMEKYGLKCGDIVMCEGGEPGRCAIWKEPVPGMMIQKALHRIRPSKGLDYRYLYYSFLHLGRTGGFTPFFTGATIKHLPRQQLAKVEVEVPPPAIQKRIAAILSAYDDLIENNRRRIALLEQAARLLYEEWFTPPYRYPGSPYYRKTAAPSPRASRPPLPVGEGPGVRGAPALDGVPKGWERNLLGDVLTLQRGFDLPTQRREYGTVPVYASTGITGHHNVAKVNGPGVVTGRSGSLGVVTYVNEAFWPLNTTLWVREFHKVSPVFAVYLLRQLRLEQYDGGVAVPTLDRKTVHRIPVVIPDEQILRLFEDSVSPVFNQVRLLQQQILSARAARDLLLPRLMSGELAL